ncbi:11002_t:CDS:2 [Cetraspora pellucida]|uniref:11002_t:CDS:1 n=1 Tax=Cetraspora pellucida TaxID=1433469 RepID=A0ACA9KEN3_9GLOM|nr:11002_t:CDS:2 [Cetraspora pellucida]
MINCINQQLQQCVISDNNIDVENIKMDIDITQNIKMNMGSEKRKIDMDSKKRKMDMDSKKRKMDIDSGNIEEPNNYGAPSHLSSNAPN